MNINDLFITIYTSLYILCKINKHSSLPVQCQCAVKMNCLDPFKLLDIIWPATINRKNVCQCVIGKHFRYNILSIVWFHADRDFKYSQVSICFRRAARSFAFFCYGILEINSSLLNLKIQLTTELVIYLCGAALPSQSTGWTSAVLF